MTKQISMIALMLALAACGGDSGGSTANSTTPDTSTDGGAGSGSDSGSGTDTGADTGDTLAVDAGLDQVVAEGNSVTLSASLTGSATVTWEQISGQSVSLSDAASLNPTFTAPDVANNTTLVFEVTADDGSGARVSDTLSVEIWVPFDQTEATNLGDFSDKDGWQCDVTLDIESDYAETAQGSEISLTSNSIPNGYTVGSFPNAGNPNSISAQSNLLNVPLDPEKTDVATDPRIFGVTVDGLLMERETAECYNNEQSCDWRYEALTVGVATNAGNTNWVGAQSEWIGTDCNNAHVQPTGNYHLHGLPEAMVNSLGEDGTGMVRVGTAGDGFPIYARWGYADPMDPMSDIVRMEASWEVKSGTRSSGPGGSYSGIFLQDWEFVEGSGDLDECSGRFGVTPEYPDGIYHYYLTDDYPFIPRCFFGTAVDDAFVGAPGPQG